jgi:proteasome accessory factor B
MLELLLLLLDADQPLSRAEIFDAIPAYRTTKPSAGERKFERDKKDLREVGVPMEERRGAIDAYSVDRRAYELAPVDFDEDERAALVLAAEAVRTSGGLPYRDLVEEALRKLSSERGLTGRERVPPHLAVSLVPRRRGKRMRGLVGGLTRATEDRKRVRIMYAPEDQEPVQREVDPYAVVYRAGDWLLVGYCHLRAALRTFRVDRIRSLRVAPRPGTPDFDRPEGPALGRALRTSPWQFHAGTSARLEVVLDIGPERAWIADEDFGDDARREPLAGGWMRLRFRSGNPDYIVTRVLDAAGHLRVVGPGALRDRVGRVAAEVAALYSAGRPVSS